VLERNLLQSDNRCTIQVSHVLPCKYTQVQYNFRLYNFHSSLVMEDIYFKCLPTDCQLSVFTLPRFWYHHSFSGHNLNIYNDIPVQPRCTTNVGTKFPSSSYSNVSIFIWRLYVHRPEDDPIGMVQTCHLTCVSDTVGKLWWLQKRGSYCKVGYDLYSKTLLYRVSVGM